MKNLLLLLCLLGSAFAVRQDKKINLDDIERDNLKSERKAKQEKQEAKTVTTTSTYIEQQPELQAAPQISYIQQAAPPTSYIQQAPPQPSYIQQFPQQTSYIQQVPTQYSYAPVKTLQNYVQQQQTVAPQLYSRLSQYEVPVVADNSIVQPNYYSQPQRQQQYVYLQPAAASQVEPRATIQYVMYIPAPVAAGTSPAATYVASPKTESLLQSAQEYLNALPLPQAYAAQEYSYDVAPAPAPAPAPQRYVQQQVKYAYVQAQDPPQVTEASSEAPEQHQQYVAVAPKEPKSLLDSYVPSYLQVQYYKQQQQAQRNSIEDSGNGKVVSSSISGKTDIVKSHRGSASSYHYNYQIPDY